MSQENENNEEINKIFIPEEYIDNAYSYYIEGNNIVILTACENNQCTCVDYLTDLGITTEEYYCNTQDLKEISIEKISSENKYNILEQTKDVQIFLVAILLSIFLIRMLGDW